MADVHPLTEIVARAICCGEHCTAKSVAEDCIAGRCVNQANAAIREVLTFEPTESVIAAGFAIHPCASGVSNSYRAMTAALLKEIENG